MDKDREACNTCDVRETTGILTLLEPGKTRRVVLRRAPGPGHEGVTVSSYRPPRAPEVFRLGRNVMGFTYLKNHSA